MAMTYEIDRPRAVQSKKNLIELLAVLLAGAAGVASALTADFVQKGDASAIFVMNALFNQHLDVTLEPLLMAIGLMLAGAVTVFIFEPRNKRSAYYMGASVLAVLWASMPSDGVQGVAPEILNEASALESPVGFDCSLDKQPRIMNASLSETCSIADNGSSTLLHNVRNGDRLPVHLQVLVPYGTQSVPRISTRLYDSVTGRKWDLSSVGIARRTSSGYLVSYKTYIDAGRRSADSQANLYVRVEAEGFDIAQARESISHRSTGVAMPISLKPSSTPLWLLRLRTPRQF